MHDVALTMQHELHVQQLHCSANMLKLKVFYFLFQQTVEEAFLGIYNDTLQYNDRS